MTVASVPPPLALGTVAAPRLDPALVALATGVASGATGAAQGGAIPAVVSETVPPTVVSQQVAAALIDALALKAAAQAVQSEGGLALLLADLSQALRIPALPEPVQAAISQILALRLPLDAPPTIADLKAALAPTNPFNQAPAAGASALAETPPEPASSFLSGGPHRIHSSERAAARLLMTGTRAGGATFHRGA